MQVVNCLADNSSHLIGNVDSNRVEHYNSSVAMFTGGKRVNFSQRGSYQARCAAAVVSHNTGRLVYKLHKSLIKSSPRVFCKLYESRVSAAARTAKKPRVKRCLKMSSGKDNDDKSYGPSAQKPDIAKELCTKRNLKNI